MRHIKEAKIMMAWIRLADIGDLEMINKVLVTREITENSISKTSRVI